MNKEEKQKWIKNADSLDAFSQRVLLKLLLSADRAGRVCADVFQLRTLLFPDLPDVRTSELIRCLRICVGAGFFRVFRVPVTGVASWVEPSCAIFSRGEWLVSSDEIDSRAESSLPAPPRMEEHPKSNEISSEIDTLPLPFLPPTPPIYPLPIPRGGERASADALSDPSTAREADAYPAGWAGKPALEAGWRQWCEYLFQRNRSRPIPILTMDAQRDVWRDALAKHGQQATLEALEETRAMGFALPFFRDAKNTRPTRPDVAETTKKSEVSTAWGNSWKGGKP